MMMFWNGEMVPADAPVVGADSRAFRYGDGFFDTFRTRHGRPLFWDAHWHRIQQSARFLHLRLPSGLTSQALMLKTEELCSANGADHAMVRLQVWRSGRGLYRPETDDSDWALQCNPLESPEFVLNDKGLMVGLHTACPVPPAPLGSHKTLNALPYVLAGIHCREKGWDDALLLDSDGRITEATSSNIILLKDRELLTPDLSKGGLPGIMRTQVMALARAAGYQVSVGSVTDREMKWADECLLTNSVHGIRWVLAFGQKRYFHRDAERFVKELNRLAQFS
ncbi:MAG: aminotransferase class IV [Flavobacteriales bacterium]|nr:aminotransferase class IV [Flavobacteriales bacterium]